MHHSSSQLLKEAEAEMSAAKGMMEIWARVASALASFMFFWAIISQYLPANLKFYFDKSSLFSYFDPFIRITINEFSSDRLGRSSAFAAVQAYLSKKTWKHSKRLKAESAHGISKPVLSMDDDETIIDEYKGAKVWWVCVKLASTKFENHVDLFHDDVEKRVYTLKFHRRYLNVVTEDYLEFVVRRGNEIIMNNRQRKLYTNNSSMWSHVVFEHPATFDSLAMDPEKKQDIIDDLLCFSKNEDFYKLIGKAWKRGYLLYGPPGTGKSTTIAAMANLLHYDVYDLELTSVKSNNELKKLLIQTKPKSIIVFEDIDCSSDLAGKRAKKNINVANVSSSQDDNSASEFDIWDEAIGRASNSKSNSKLTLSGLLNFIDGIWSASSGERLIVFTTNFVEKLDPALIRRGRMDKHIELSYCCFEGFKMLAKNYLKIESHESFEKIKMLLNETKITPADVAERFMPTSPKEDPEDRLMKLIQVLEEMKKGEAGGSSA